jgi:amino acid adenylation domain-containing protein
MGFSERRINELSPQRRAVLEKLIRDQRGLAPGPSIVAGTARGGPAPLSFAQERLWVLDQLMPESTLYNVSSVSRIEGAVDELVLERSLNEIVRRHEALRTTFKTINGEPFQVVAPTFRLPLRCVDLEALEESEREAETIRLVRQESQRPFDLASGPLLRTTLIKISTYNYLIVITMHHIVSDSWSVGLFWKELSAIWDAFAHGSPSPLPEPSIQYADFAVWQRDWLQGAVLERQLAYWKGQLANLTVLELPTDHPRPAVQSGHGAVHFLTAPPSLAAAIRSLCQREGVTLFMTLLAAFQTLLSRWSGQDDVAVGTFIANRNHLEVEELIGFFVNTLVLRADLSGNPSFRELLGQIRKTTLDAYAHEDLPFGRLVQELHPERDLSRNPLFQVAFQLLNAPTVAKAGSYSSDPLLEVQRETAIFDLTLSLSDGGDSLTGEIEYNSDLYEADTIRRMASHYLTLLGSIVADPDRPIRDSSILSGVERRQLFVDWNATAADYPREASIVSLFEVQAARTPDATALVCEGVHVSYCELNRRANQLGRHLRTLGIRTETRVGICTDRSIGMVVALLATLKACGAYVPLDPAYPIDRLAYMVDDAGVEVIVSQERLIGRLPRNAARVVLLEDLCTPAPENEDDLGIPVMPDNVAYVVYTSGSTGRPKGVLAVHRSAVNRFAWMWEAYPFGSHEICCARTSLSFVDSVWEIFGPLLRGIPTVIIPEDKLKDVSQLVAILGVCHVTRLVLVPSLLDAMLESFDDLGTRVPKLRYWVTSGEALSADLASRFRQSVPHGILINLYGSSEVAGDSTCFDTSTEACPHCVPIGRPISNLKTYVVDQNLQPVPVGVPGELLVGGDGLARGYHNLPGLTAERFIPNPFDDQPGARLYRTGDRARYLPDGNIAFLGRCDRQVKIRGFRIEPGEVEAVLAQHPGLEQVVVLPRERSDGEQHLIAYVVRKPAANGSVEQGLDTARSTDQVQSWQEVWDETYRRDCTQEDPTFNINGWTSSYTNAPIPADEMREWVEQSARRLRSLEPTRVLEIGCGVGLLLFRLAPYCARYWGTDISPVALRHVERQLGARGLHHIRLLQRGAEDFSGLEPDGFDAVILNSVVQYLPHINLLVSVLEGALKVVCPGGFIFVGDVRSLPFLGAFHTSVELDRAAQSLPVGQLQKRVREHMIAEEELVIDPAFFLAMQRRFPQITQVQIEPKRGHYRNEMTRFRYDVTLHVNVPPVQLGTITRLDWRSDRVSLRALRDMLREGRIESLAVTHIPNARLAVDIRAWELLIDPDGLETADELRDARLDVPDVGVDPEELWALQDDGLYLVHLDWPAHGADGHYNALFRRRDLINAGEADAISSVFPIAVDEQKPWAAYSNNPLESSYAHAFAADLRRFGEAKLPEYMVPSHYVTLEAIPRTPNGKLDRTALLTLDKLGPGTQDARLLPRTRTEQILAGIWSQILGVERIATHDNFFDLGGHSLLATRVLARLREIFQLELPLRAIFDAPTVAGFAELIERTRERGDAQCTVITRLSRAAHAAKLLPGGVLDPAELSKGRRG